MNINTFILFILCCHPSLPVLPHNPIPSLYVCTKIDSCEYTCSSSTVKSIADELVTAWSVLKCGRSGIQLQLDSTVKYEKSRLEQGWFKGSVNVSSLVIDTLLIDEIHAQAFRTNSFSQTLTELTLQNLHVRQLVPGTFTGLQSLRSLILQPLISTDYTPAFFSGIQMTLRQFTFSNVYLTKPVLIEGITGGQSNTLPKLRTARFQTNLKDTITNASFWAFPNARQLIMSQCNIELLGMDSFVPLQRLRYLDLEGNVIKTIPANIFQPFIGVRDLRIDLQANLWHCDCALFYLQQQLLTNDSDAIFTDSLICSTPMFKQGALIVSVTLCDTETTNEEFNEAATTRMPMEKLQYLICAPHEEYLSLRRSQYRRMYITINAVGNLITSSFESDLVLLWFHGSNRAATDDDDDDDGATSCHIGSPYGVHVKDLRPNVVYTFCQMNRTELIVSPLDCLSYYHLKSVMVTDVWIFSDDKEAYIGYYIICLIGCGTIGAVLGFVCCKTIETIASNKKGGDDEWTKSRNDQQMETVEYCQHYYSLPSENNINNPDALTSNKYELPINPSRFDIVQRQLEMAKYQRPENQYNLEEIPVTTAPQLPAPPSLPLTVAGAHRLWQRLPSADLDDYFPHGGDDVVYYECFDPKSNHIL